MPIRTILALDGGGIRGVLTARLLTRLTDERPQLLERIDLFAGTSTGAMLATGLAAGVSAAEITELYVDHGETIFDARFPGFTLSGFYARKARYKSRALGEILAEIFRRKGCETLADLPRRVLLSSFDLAHPAVGGRPAMWAPKFFHNIPGPDSDGEEEIVEVLLRSAAAPTYFPTYGTFVDGGVVANNPSLCALAQAIHENCHREDPAEPREEVGKALDKLVLLSLGTGLNVRLAPDEKRDWGWTQWMFQPRLSRCPPFEPPIVNLMLEGGVDLARYQCRQLLGDRFLRLDPQLEEPWDLDEIRRVPELLKAADDEPLDEALEWLDHHFP